MTALTRMERRKFLGALLAMPAAALVPGLGRLLEDPAPRRKQSDLEANDGKPDADPGL